MSRKPLYWKTKSSWVLILLLVSNLSLAAELRKPAQSGIDAELEEEMDGLSKEEQSFVDEEYSPPKEAPYVDENAAANPPTPPPTAPSAVPYRAEPTVKFEQSGLKKVTAKGEYIYQVYDTPQNWAARLRVGPFAPPQLSSNIGGQDITFSDIYGDTHNLMFLLDVEYQLFSKVGKLGIRAGTGFYTAQGNGRFLINPNKIAREKYNFYLAPNSLDAIYHFDYFRRQILVPYVFGGGYYFTFLEARDDNDPLKYGGATAANMGGGLALLLDSFDTRSVNQLDADYGVNHVYLVAEFEQIIGLDSRFDFTNQIFSGGIQIEF